MMVLAVLVLEAPDFRLLIGLRTRSGMLLLGAGAPDALVVRRLHSKL